MSWPSLGFPSPPIMQSRALPLHWKIVIALVLAVIAGLTFPEQIGTLKTTAVFDFFGKLFLRGLQMLVVPLIFLAVVSALAKMGEEKAFGRLGIKTMGFYASSTLLAVLIGLVCTNTIKPGKVAPDVSEAMIAAAVQNSDKVATKWEGRDAGDVVAVFQRMIPSNVVEAASQNSEMLAVIFFSILFGYFITQLPEERRERYARWWDDGYEVMIKMTHWVISFTPYGVFALVAATVAETGLAAFAPLAKFFFTVLLGLALHMFVALPLLLKFFGLPAGRHYRAMAPALLTAFSTASSAAALPLNLECAQKNAGVSKRVASFTLPLGATINMDGTALYECAVVLFIAQIYGVDLSVGTQVMVVMLSLLTSIGVAGIPAASLVAIVIILGAVGLPKEAIGLVLAVDRILDMCRTTVNIFGDTCCAVIVAKTEGETPYQTVPAKTPEPSVVG
jgi:proton glutamate symport protein